MKQLRLTCSAVALAYCTMSGGVSNAGAAQDAPPVYDATEVAFNQYVVIARLGMEGWRSAFRLRGHPTLEAARQALLDEAARAGADAVVNLTCFDQADALFKTTGYLCYANAVRVKR